MSIRSKAGSVLSRIRRLNAYGETPPRWTYGRLVRAVLDDRREEEQRREGMRIAIVRLGGDQPDDQPRPTLQ